MIDDLDSLLKRLEADIARTNAEITALVQYGDRLIEMHGAVVLEIAQRNLPDNVRSLNAQNRSTAKVHPSRGTGDNGGGSVIPFRRKVRGTQGGP